MAKVWHDVFSGYAVTVAVGQSPRRCYSGCGSAGGHGTGGPQGPRGC